MLSRDLRGRPEGPHVVPNKVFEGAAAGWAIITSDTAPQRRALGDAAIFVGPADARSLAETLPRAVGGPGPGRWPGGRSPYPGSEQLHSGTVVGPLRRRLLGTRPG